MTKEEFICASLPYGLICEAHYFEGGTIINKKHKPVTGYSKEKSQFYEYLVKVGYPGKEEFRSEKSILPIIHPLSDLTKEIEHNGEKLIPIIELIKTIYEKMFHSEIESFNIEFIGEEDYCFGCVIQNNSERIGFTIDTNTYLNRFEFELSINSESMKLNQLQLFQKLLEWHFDISGLIEIGEAIDVNTLDINPYIQ